MILASELIYNIKNLKEGGLHSDDVELSDDQYLFIANYYRAKIIRQQFSKNDYNLNGLSQNIPKVKLTTTTTATDSIPANGCLTEVIPSMLQLPNGLAVIIVGNITTPFQYIHQARAYHIEHARHTSEGGYFFPFGGDRLCLMGDSRLNKIKTVPLVAVFENPIAVYEFVSGVALDNYDVNYPISNTYLDIMFKMMIESEIKLTTILPDLNTNDTKDDQ